MLQRVITPALAVVTVFASTVFGLARPATGDAIGDARAKAAAIEAQLTQAQEQMSALSQQYDAAVYHLSQINSNITSTKATIAADHQQVQQDKTVLAKAAVANYISDGTAASQDPIFSGNEKTLGASTEYTQIATGDLNLAVDNLHTAQTVLAAQQSQLQGEQSQAQVQVAAEQNAVNQNAAAIQQQKSALSQEQGQIATLVQAATAGRRRSGSSGGGGQAARRPRGRPASGGDPQLVGGDRPRAAPRSPASPRPHHPPQPREARARSRRPRASSVFPTSGPGSPPRDRPAPASTAPGSRPGRGDRWAWASPTTRVARWPTRRPFRSATFRRVTSSSTVRAAPSTWPCTSGAAR